MDYIMREVRRTDGYNLALDAYHFSKGIAGDTVDGFKEGAPGVLEMLERAGRRGLEWMRANALEGAQDGVQMMLEMLQHAAEMGEEFAETAADMLAAYWGYRNGKGPPSESGVWETELVQMVAKDSPCPTE